VYTSKRYLQTPRLRTRVARPIFERDFDSKGRWGESITGRIDKRLSKCPSRSRWMLETFREKRGTEYYDGEWRKKSTFRVSQLPPWQRNCVRRVENRQVIVTKSIFFPPRLLKLVFIYIFTRKSYTFFGVKIFRADEQSMSLRRKDLRDIILLTAWLMMCDEVISIFGWKIDASCRIVVDNTKDWCTS